MGAAIRHAEAHAAQAQARDLHAGRTEAGDVHGPGQFEVERGPIITAFGCPGVSVRDKTALVARQGYRPRSSRAMRIRSHATAKVAVRRLILWRSAVSQIFFSASTMILSSRTLI